MMIMTTTNDVVHFLPVLIALSHPRWDLSWPCLAFFSQSTLNTFNVLLVLFSLYSSLLHHITISFHVFPCDIAGAVLETRCETLWAPGTSCADLWISASSLFPLGMNFRVCWEYNYRPNKKFLWKLLEVFKFMSPLRWCLCKHAIEGL